VLEETGLAVSIGGGTSRLIAKMAVEDAKPSRGASGVHCVAPGEEARYLARFRLADLPMVGPRLNERLEAIGLVRVSDAQAAGEARLVRALGERAGQWLHARVHGIDPSIVEPREQQKSVSREDTFARDLADDDALERELLRLAVRVSADLRGHALEARTVTVKLRTRDFRSRTAQRALPQPIVTEQAVFRVARSLLRKLRRTERAPVRLLGIGLSHFAGKDAEAAQLGLFDEATLGATSPRGTGASGDASPPDQPIEGARERALSAALDRIRGRFGAQAIQPATLADRRNDPGPRVEDEPE
jgi:DNA polymerase-4